MNAREILNKVEQFYASLETYQDVGFVEEVLNPGSPEESNWRVDFRTYFVRPLYFRFEWVERESQIWSGAMKKGAFGKFLDEEVEQNDLAMLIAGATGVSRGAAHNVSSLLLDEIGGTKLTEPKVYALGEDQEFEGQDCFSINVDDGIGSRRLFISKESFSIVGILSKIESISEALIAEMQDTFKTLEKDFPDLQNLDFENIDLRTNGKLVYSRTIFDEPVNSETFQVSFK